MRAGRALVIVLVGLVVLGVPSRARAQISPGPLARAHASLEGAGNCIQCHGLKKEPMTQRCLACHKEVGWLAVRDRGLHARERTGEKRECASCHPDHAGADFALIDWGKGGQSGFDHARTGWALEGKHERAKCAACHATKYRTSPAAALSPRKAGAGWMGLETGCVSCHQADDVHKSALGEACARCHDAADWRKAPRFDHARSSYPLTGKHERVECDKCHKAAQLGLKPRADGRVIGLFKPLRSAECSACHADPHRGRLGAKCSNCHETRDFTAINRVDFDHAVTRYALTGKHRAVKCEACHGPNLARKTPAFASCADCHGDAHAGGAMTAGKLTDCAACHRVEGFAPSTFTAARHATLAFPLRGKHAAARCASCHVPRDSMVVRAAARVSARVVPLHPAATACSDCHADAHPGELSRSTTGGVCTACHTESGWSPSTFGSAQHATLQLPLDGAHATVACAACHPATPARAAAPRGRVPSATVQLRAGSGACEACHVDPHIGRYSAGGANPLRDGCRACHDTRRFTPAALDAKRHATLGFPLDGSHRAVPCRDCHRELDRLPASRTLRTMSPSAATLRFDAPRRTACAACHEDPHGGQFATRRGGGACETCHDAARWTGAARFSHERDASFPLAGAHQRVPCVACHVRATQSGGARVRVQYRPLPTTCEGCHKAGVPMR